MNAILYVTWHAFKKGAAEAKRFLKKVIGQNPGAIQEISFWELTEPFIKAGFI